jgi:uncharacterized protein YhaN
VKITDVQIDGFGVWNDLKLTHLPESMAVFYGPNEAGKTTLLHFLRSILYGYDADRRSRYLPPISGGRSGGALGVVDTGGRLTVRRTPSSGLGSDELGRVEVLSSTGARQGQHVLGTLLCGIDESIFNNVFAVGLREVQELGTLDDTEAAAHLYKLTSGLDRVSLVDVMRDLAATRNQILAVDGSESLLWKLQAERERLETQLRDLSAGAGRWAQLAGQRKELQEEVARLEDSIERMERESRAVEVAIGVRADWARRADVRRRLDKLGDPIELPERVVPRLDDLNTQIRDYREQVEQIKRQRRVIVEEAAAQPINRQLWSNASRIEAVCEHGPWITSLQSQVKHLHDEIDELEKGFRAQWEQLGFSPEEIPDFTPEVSNRAMKELKEPARAMREAAGRQATAKAEREEAHAEAEEIHEQLAAALADTGEQELERALETAGLRVTRLRRRVQLEERLDKTERHRKELEDDRRELLEEQVLPVTTLVWCGVPFVLGVMMILASVFWEPVSKLGWTITILGLVCWAIAVATKLVLENSNGRELDGCVRQLDKVKKQIRTLKEERDELEQSLPAGGGPLDTRVTEAEAYVKKLEQLTPLDGQRQSALARAEAAESKMRHADEQIRAARQRWREALRAVNLPESFLPEHIEQFSEGSNQTVQLARRLQARREELRSRRHDLATITERIAELLSSVKITPASDDPGTQLRQIAAVVAEQKQWIQRRSELKAEHRELKKSFRELARKLRTLIRQRRLLINQSGAADEADLRKMAGRQAKIEQLTAELRELDQRIRLTLGNQCSEEAVAEVLETHSEDKLEAYWERLLARLQDAQARQADLHQTRGEMNQEMKTLAEDRRLPETRLQLGCVEEQIRQAVHRWRTLAVTGLMLEAIRQIYETERQPETLFEASTYLERLTEGRYTRIWTPLSENVLRVDAADGTSLSLDLLSQGTREAVFVSLRMALVAAYARRGAVLPLILDDVLVNFDTRRAKAAAVVLRDFANTGHQILMFTCHHHIMNIFQAAGVDVRPLPIRDGVDDCEPFERQAEDEEIPQPAADEQQDDVLQPCDVEQEDVEDEEFEEVVEEAVEEDHDEIEHDEIEDDDAQDQIQDAEQEEVEEAAAEEEAVTEEEAAEEDESEQEAEASEEAWEDETWDDQELTLAEDDSAAPAFSTDQLVAAMTDAFKDRWWETDDEAVA